MGWRVLGRAHALWCLQLETPIDAYTLQRTIHAQHWAAIMPFQSALPQPQQQQLRSDAIRHSSDCSQRRSATEPSDSRNILKLVDKDRTLFAVLLQALLMSWYFQLP